MRPAHEGDRGSKYQVGRCSVSNTVRSAGGWNAVGW